jgi:hypothetical protein
LLFSHREGIPEDVSVEVSTETAEAVTVQAETGEETREASASTG